jgi:cytochrome c oxidase cbb3-type subunit 3
VLRRKFAFPTLAAALLSLTAPVTLGACERAPSADQAKEWTPADHDRAEEKGNQASGAQAPAQRGDGGGGNGADQLVEMTWQNNCFACHGQLGKGDGPSGPMVGAKDLTRTDWQSTVSDADMAAAILGGKGRMPKFDLPEPVVKGLVGRIRTMKGR